MMNTESYVETWNKTKQIINEIKYFYFGNLLGLLGNKNEGIKYLEKVIKVCNERINGEKIPQMENLGGYIYLEKREKEIWSTDKDMKVSKKAIEYMELNSPLAELSIEEIIRNEKRIGLDLVNMGDHIFSPLVRAEELRKRGASYQFHPNFINCISEFGYPDFACHTCEDGIKKEFYVLNPLPKEVIEKSKELSHKYYNDKKISYGHEKFNVDARIKFEEDWSATAIKVYEHYANNYLKEVITK